MSDNYLFLNVLSRRNFKMFIIFTLIVVVVMVVVAVIVNYLYLYRSCSE